MPLIARSTMRLGLTATAIFLSACSLTISIDVDCSWSKPIRFSEPTKAWRANQIPWPAALRADLIKITKHNKKFVTFCG